MYNVHIITKETVKIKYILWIIDDFIDMPHTIQSLMQSTEDDDQKDIKRNHPLYTFKSIDSDK